MITGNSSQGPDLSVRVEARADEVRKFYLMARAVRLGRRFSLGAEGKAGAGGSVLAIDGGISQKLSHIGCHQQNVGVAALDDLVVVATLIEGEFETVASIHQAQDLAGTLFVPFLDFL
jgi:hypothetical protein